MTNHWPIWVRLERWRLTANDNATIVVITPEIAAWLLELNVNIKVKENADVAQ